MDGSGYLLEDLKSCVVLVNLGICGIFKLLGNVDSGVLLSHFHSGLKALVHAGSDISRIVDKNNFCSVVLNKESSLRTYAIRHDDLGLIAHYRTDECKAYSLVSAGGLYDDGIVFDNAVFKSLLYHVVSGTGLDGSTYVKAFVFYKNLRSIGIVHSVKSYYRSVSDIFKYVIADHYFSHLRLINFLISGIY